jgi:hypothetical protein
VIVLESNHLEAPALCKFRRKSGELAVREKCYFKLMKAAYILGETGERIVGKVENLKAVEEVEDVPWKVVEAAG